MFSFRSNVFTVAQVQLDKKKTELDEVFFFFFINLLGFFFLFFFIQRKTNMDMEKSIRVKSRKTGNEKPNFLALSCCHHRNHRY